MTTTWREVLVSEEARADGWFVRPAGPSGAVEEADRVASRLAAPSGHASPAGLPVRTPRAHLVPGAFRTGTTEEGPRRDAEEVRSRLSGFAAGARRARRPAED